MLTALLPNGKVVHSSEYSEEKHGYTLYCIDPQCKAPVIYVGASSSSETKRSAYFKTVGKDIESKHKESCGFFEPLDVVEAIQKTALYQKQILESDGVPKQIINLNLKKLDPDYIPKEPVERKEKTPENDKIKVKDDRDTPGTIGSLKSIVKLLTSYEPDILATLYFNVGGGRKLPLSQVVMSPDRAYDLLWQDMTIPRMQYFVYGRISEVTKLEKVTYIDMDIDDEEKPFTIVIFAEYYKHFIYEKKDLVGKEFLIFGDLRKNTYNNINKAQIVIKSSDYLEPIRTKKRDL
ncbi:hypothetical protein ACFQI7_28125 [Paenibacillus allorhizosphaerae]|uniref:GIY-YIG nuclease family protein n=1 Tax=Paenibacillus allorhizosphaerae TaxID=2849866 RepID=A0ABN7TQL9_9BACL|nr:hypothetical protein [Paenibacillus allorhizosphaerae]CAG7651522.1 hypothetical protein PAECIP111802_04985 [Paenibacillus allorhizosphaerae]